MNAANPPAISSADGGHNHTRRIRCLQSITLVTLILRALERARTQPVFDCDPYESRRTALKGEMLLKALMVSSLLKSPTQRGLIETVGNRPELQRALGG